MRPYIVAASWSLRIASQPQDGDTPLHAAAFKGQLPVAQALIAGGADVNATNGVKETEQLLCRTAV